MTYDKWDSKSYVQESISQWKVVLDRHNNYNIEKERTRKAKGDSKKFNQHGLNSTTYPGQLLT